MPERLPVAGAALLALALLAAVGSGFAADGVAATLAGLRDAPARVAAMSEVLVEARGVASQERHLAGLLDAYEAAIRRHQERRSAPGVSSA